MDQPEEYEDGVDRDHEHRERFYWARLQELQAEQLELRDLILLLENLLCDYNLIFVLPEMHKPPYHNAVDTTEDDKTLQVVDDNTHREGSKQHLRSSIANGHIQYMNCVEEQVTGDRNHE